MSAPSSPSPSSTLIPGPELDAFTAAHSADANLLGPETRPAASLDANGAIVAKRSTARAARAGSGGGGSVKAAGSGSYYSTPVEMPLNPPFVVLRSKAGVEECERGDGETGEVDECEGESARVVDNGGREEGGGGDSVEGERRREEGGEVDGTPGDKTRERGGAEKEKGVSFGVDDDEQFVKKKTSIAEQQVILQIAAASNGELSLPPMTPMALEKLDSKANYGGGGESIAGAKFKKQITKVVAKVPVKPSRRRKRVKDGVLVFKSHKSWEIVISIQFGLRYSSELLKDSDDVEPTEADFRESLAFDFNPIDDQRSSSVFDVNKYAKWIHPAPFVYRRIRAKFGISEADFLEATCGESRVRELPTPGKSGQIFYITDDENYFMKTIDHEEEKVLTQMLPTYYAHVSANPNTFLTRYLAHFSVETTRNRHIRMVVMASVFNDSIFIDHKYDLKGSTYNRFASEDERASENVTLKDQDFDYPIFFSPDVVEQISSQLEKDTAFLEFHRVMDYSLLVGMSEMLPEESALYKEAYGPDEAAGPYYIGYQDNAEGVRVGHRICVGVIDFLQRFRSRKKIEYAMRVMQTCACEAASVAPPGLYRSRFLAFMKTRLLPDSSITAPGPGQPTTGAISATMPDDGEDDGGIGETRLPDARIPAELYSSDEDDGDGDDDAAPKKAIPMKNVELTTHVVR